MDTWNTGTIMYHQRVPAWLVEFAQLWTSQSATNPNYREEYQHIKHLANAADVPPFLIALRLFRDSYQIQPTTTWEQFLSCIETPRRMMLERGAHSNWAKKLVSSPRLIEGLSPFLGMGADCRERRARWEKFCSGSHAILLKGRNSTSHRPDDQSYRAASLNDR